MCIKILTLKEEHSYDMERPLEEQLRGSKKVVINYEPSDLSINHFMDQIKRICQTGVSANMNIQFNHNDHLTGARLQRETAKVLRGMDINEVIKLMTLIQSKTDNGLEELSEMCRR